MNIVCILKNRHNFSSTYDKTWVQKLSRSVKRNITVPHNFFCMSSFGDVEGVDTIPLEHDSWGDYWAKIEIFKPGLFEGPTLYTDLDTLFCRNMDAFTADHGGFVMLEDYYPTISNSSLMYFDASNKLYSGIYTYFKDNEYKVKNDCAEGADGPNFGDQLYIWRWLEANGQKVSKWQDVLPRQLFLPFSYTSRLNPEVYNWNDDNPATYVYCLGHPKFNAVKGIPLIDKHWV